VASTVSWTKGVAASEEALPSIVKQMRPSGKRWRRRAGRVMACDPFLGGAKELAGIDRAEKTTETPGRLEAAPAGYHTDPAHHLSIATL
jgi:hypothetical protein